MTEIVPAQNTECLTSMNQVDGGQNEKNTASYKYWKWIYQPAGRNIFFILAISSFPVSN